MTMVNPHSGETDLAMARLRRIAADASEKAGAEAGCARAHRMAVAMHRALSAALLAEWPDGKGPPAADLIIAAGIGLGMALAPICRPEKREALAEGAARTMAVAILAGLRFDGGGNAA
jgi:hypothetical protein